MFLEFLNVLGAALRIWEHHDKQKYFDHYVELKRRWYEEFNKDPSSRSDAVLDNVERELRIIGREYAANVRASDSTDQ